MACLCFKTVVKWFESYLSSSKFSVSLGNIFSRAALLICGVPQVFWGRYDSWYELMVFPNHYEKLDLIFIMMIHAFPVKTKTFAKLKLFWLKNSIHSAHGLVIISCRLIFENIKQSVFSSLKLDMTQRNYNVKQ